MPTIVHLKRFFYSMSALVGTPFTRPSCTSSPAHPSLHRRPFLLKKSQGEDRWIL